jgi:hypothetical protein
MDPDTQQWTIRRTVVNHWVHVYNFPYFHFLGTFHEVKAASLRRLVSSDLNALSDFHDIRYSIGLQKESRRTRVSFAKIDSVKNQTSFTGANKCLPSAWLHTSAANTKRSSLLWDVGLRWLVVSDVSGQPIDPIFTSNLRYLTSQKSRNIKFCPTSHIF